MNTDSVVKKALLKAPIERVWAAIADSSRFGVWFGARFDGPFVQGGHLVGRMEPTEMDAQVAAMQEPHRGKPFDVWIEELEPMKRLVFRWQAYEPADGEDRSQIPTTRASFEIEAVDGGTMLTITESGYDAIPIERRDEVRKGNEGGWELQLTLIARYMERDARG